MVQSYLKPPARPKSNDKVNINVTEIDAIETAPARKRDIALWLLTGGRFGKLWVKNQVKKNLYSAPPSSINCRCATRIAVTNPDVPTPAGPILPKTN